MKSDLNKTDELTRRQFMANAAKTYLGVGLSPMLGASLAGKAMAQTGSKSQPAEAVIFLNMSGGMSHIDTFDVKPGNKEIQGPVNAIGTSADGIQISQYLPKTAAVMDKICVIRSMSNQNGDHFRGQYMLHRNYAPRATITHPTVGAWVMKVKGRKNTEIPGFVTVGTGAGHASPGFFGVKYGGVPLGRPDEGLKDSTIAGSVSVEDFDRRLKLADALNKEFHSKHNNTEALAYDELYDEAVRLMKSEDLKAFDIRDEPKSEREAYGEHAFGQGCMLGGWDTHYDNFTAVEARCNVLDQAYANLLIDLEAKGLLDTTIVALSTEFGRTPEIHGDRKNGRNHHPRAYSSLLAGGGIKGGMVYGSTDADGNSVKEDKVSTEDFNATIAHGMGIDTTSVLLSPSGRPFKIGGKDGKPVKSLYS